MGIDEISERLGALTAAMEGLGRRIDEHLEADARWHITIETQIRDLGTTISEARGGKRMLVWLIGIVLVVGGFVVGAKANAAEDVVLLSVTLQQTPCAPEVLRHIPSQARERFKAGTGRYDNKPYAICWAEGRDGVIVVWSDGWVMSVGRGRPVAGI